ncbi:MAG: alpha/beta hydrolase [Vicinamibacterales bacterium]
MLRMLRLFALPAIIIAVIAAAVLPAQRLRPSDVDRLPSKLPDARVAYGSDPLQFGELRLPKGTGPFAVAVVIHGGCWVSEFASLQNTAAMADALRDAGLATWNVEYRRLNNAGGGWPGTFADIAAGTDHVRELAKQYPLDLRRVATIGHSAGGHLALWAAARSRLSRTSALHRDNPLPLRAAIALGGPGSLRDFSRYASSICGSHVVEKLLGGTSESVPERYAQASPVEMLPLGVPQLLIVGNSDAIMPRASREAYAAAARNAGDTVEIVEVPGGHFEIIAPTSAAWPAVQQKLLELLK